MWPAIHIIISSIGISTTENCLTIINVDIIFIVILIISFIITAIITITRSFSTPQLFLDIGLDITTVTVTVTIVIIITIGIVIVINSIGAILVISVEAGFVPGIGFDSAISGSEQW